MPSKKKNKLFWLWTDKSATVEEICKCVGEGWTQLIKDLIEKLLSLNWDGGIYQVKEKYGGLRFYINSNPVQFKALMEAEAKSFKTCEKCGKKGKERFKGTWVMVRCNGCWDKDK